MSSVPPSNDGRAGPPHRPGSAHDGRRTSCEGTALGAAMAAGRPWPHGPIPRRSWSGPGGHGLPSRSASGWSAGRAPAGHLRLGGLRRRRAVRRRAAVAVPGRRRRHGSIWRPVRSPRLASRSLSPSAASGCCCRCGWSLRPGLACGPGRLLAPPPCPRSAPLRSPWARCSAGRRAAAAALAVLVAAWSWLAAAACGRQPGWRPVLAGLAAARPPVLLTVGPPDPLRA